MRESPVAVLGVMCGSDQVRLLRFSFISFQLDEEERLTEKRKKGTVGRPDSGANRTCLCVK